jgi:Rhs element Vgr protein
MTAPSPNDNTDGALSVTLSCDGTAQPDLNLMSVTIRTALNRIPYAEIIIDDGDMPTGAFAVADEALFAPGTAVTVSARYISSNNSDAPVTPLFSGIVVRFGVKIGDGNYSRLTIECRDAATKMTIGRKNANYVDQKDSDIISTLVAAHGLSAEVAATTLQYPELVQYYCSDWDFMLARAEVNGLLVNVAAGKVSVQPPDVSASPVLTVGWGQELMSFQADMDARRQLSSAQATSWDPKQQAIVQGNAASPPTLNAQGNLSSAALADVASPATYVLQTSAAQPRDLLSTWATAQQLKAGLARIRGRMRFQGSALALPGSLITVKGVGARFNGDVFVSAVEHRIEHGNWLTEVEFGMDTHWNVERSDVMAPANGGLLPGIGGLQIGVVMKLDGDPEGQQRIQVQVPVLQAQTQGVWARLLQFYASNAFGAFFLPEVGDEVILGYLNDDPSCPVVLGSVYSAARTPPYPLAAENNTKALVTRCLHRVVFDEENKIITITTPGKNTMVFSDQDTSILIQDQNNNSIKLSSSGIALDSPFDISLTAKGGITLSAVNNISLKAQANVEASGLNVSCEAQVGFTGKGSATAELSASGQTTVKGAIVMIN